MVISCFSNQMKHFSGKTTNWFHDTNNESATEKKCVFTWVYCLSLLFPYLSCANCHGFGEKSNVVQPLSLLPSQYGIALLILLMNEQPILLFRVHVQHDSAIIRTFRSFFSLCPSLSLFFYLYTYLQLTKEQSITKMKERRTSSGVREYTHKKKQRQKEHILQYRRYFLLLLFSFS